LTDIARDECAGEGSHRKENCQDSAIQQLDQKKHVKSHYYAFVTGGGLLEDFETNRKEQRRRCDTLEETVVADLQQLIFQDPGRSMRSMARELGLSFSTV
jgi:hypothetical protein